MTQLYLGRGGDRRAIRLGKLLGEGAAGKVHALPDMPGIAAKLYHGPEESRRHEAKIDAMLANPPDLPPAAHEGVNYPQIAWPEAKLYDASGRFVGFLMPEIDFGRSTSLVNLLQKSSRRVEKLSDYYGYRVLVARNLASVFAELHRAGHHMIDMKPANLRFYPAVCWMAVVDTDGFSIAANAAGSRGRIPAAQLSDEYIAPESWQREPAELGVEQDLFALAVIIFQLLNNGVHPFAGAKGASDEATDLQTRILEGLYPYALRPRAGLSPGMASVHRMFRRGTRVMFDAAFVPGGPRPTAEEWREHLDLLVEQLAPCEANPEEHVHFGTGCGFCAHEARVAGAMAAAVRAGQTRRQPAPSRAMGSVQGRPVGMRPRVTPVLRPTAPPPFPLARSRRRRWAGTVTTLSLLVAVLATQELWRPLLPAADPARAAEIAAVDRAPAMPAGGLIAYVHPRDYLIVPASGELSVAAREGAGDKFGVVNRLELHQRVVGQGTRVDARGVQWVWVTRESDGAAGFVPRDALLSQGGAVEELDDACAVAGGCSDWMDEADQLVDARHMELLARADVFDQPYLIEGRKLWEEQRRRCDSGPDAKACGKRVNARWLAELEKWRATMERRRRESPGALLTSLGPAG